MSADPRSRARRRRDTEHRLTHDIKVRVLMTVSSTGPDGPRPEPNITPDPEWVDKPAP